MNSDTALHSELRVRHSELVYACTAAWTQHIHTSDRVQVVLAFSTAAGCLQVSRTLRQSGSESRILEPGQGTWCRVTQVMRGSSTLAKENTFEAHSVAACPGGAAGAPECPRAQRVCTGAVRAKLKEHAALL